MAPPQHCDGLCPPQGLLGLLLLSSAVCGGPPTYSVSSAVCGRPPPYSNMDIIGTVKTLYHYGERTEYRCKPGYLRRPLLITMAVCGPAGIWSPVSTDACYKKSCTFQMDPVNGQVNLPNGSYEFGTQIQFVCNDGFYLIGSEILYCLLNGSNVEWSNEAPVCEKISCHPPSQIPNGYYSSGKEVFEYLEAVTYTCNHNAGPDKFSLVGESQLYCLGLDTWSSSPPECKVVRCPQPAVPNGRQTSGFGVKHYYKATVMFECNQGFFLHGSDTIVCGAESAWQPPVPRCLNRPPPSMEKPPVSLRQGLSLPSRRPEPPTPGGGRPRAQPVDRQVMVLIAVYFLGILILCTCLYKFIKGRN